MKITAKKPDSREFEEVKKMVQEFWLDNDAMQPEQFRILTDGNQLVAFGRLRENEDATELCTMGVARQFQKKGFGEKMVNTLLGEAKRDVYLVTVIPDFFKKLGFEFAEEYPGSIRKKAEICSNQYHTGEKYWVIKWEKK